jgi:hypothetical protein
MYNTSAADIEAAVAEATSGQQQQQQQQQQQGAATSSIEVHTEPAQQRPKLTGAQCWALARQHMADGSLLALPSSPSYCVVSAFFTKLFPRDFDRVGGANAAVDLLGSIRARAACPSRPCLVGGEAPGARAATRTNHLFLFPRLCP